MMDEGKAIFMIPDGSLAMQIKNFLVQQERCLEVTVDSEVFPGINFQKKSKTFEADKTLIFIKYSRIDYL